MLEDGELFEGSGHHSFIVCNAANPTELVILVTATSQLQKRVEALEKRGFPVESLVHIGAGEYRHFSQVTAFDCNYPQIIKLQRIIELHDEGKARIISDCQLSKKHMDLIEQGLMCSPLVSQEIQDLVDTNLQ
jgi:hypothetical protein